MKLTKNNIWDKLESWNDIRNTSDEDIYADIVTRFHAGKKMHRLEIEWMLNMIKEKANEGMQNRSADKRGKGPIRQKDSPTDTISR